MIFRLVALVGLLVLVYWGLNATARKYSLNQGQAYLLLFLGVLLTAVIVMIVIGRLPVQFIIAPIGVAVTYLARMLPHLIRLMPLWVLMRNKMSSHRIGHGRQSNQTSRIQTAFLAMELFHGSGDMEGEVLKGQFQGNKLSGLSLSQLLELSREVRDDTDSRQVLEAYLDRMHADWRESAQSQAQQEPEKADESRMTRSLALEILGLSEPVRKEQVVHAHRKLMQKLHPDRGGSDYLAKKINSARDFLEANL